MNPPHPPESSDPRIGTVIADRYRLLAKLGEGGMGAVYRGVHETLRKPVAVKFLLENAHADKELVARFEREAIATANLKHPNISESTDYGQLPDGTLFLVMEYLDGKNLREVAAGGRLPPARAFALLKQVGAALSFAHGQDVVHRDLKPDNVIVFDRGTDRDLVKVIDFGIARMSSTFGGGKTALTKAGAVFGTPDYMAPEQAMGQAVDARADQYALGAMAFELFTGKPPYASDNVASLLYMHVGAPIPRVTDLAPEVPPAVADVVEKMMGKLPDERFPSVADAIAALGAAVDAPVSSAQLPSVTAQLPPASTQPRVTPAPVSAAAATSGALTAPTAPPAGTFPLKWLAALGAALVVVLGGLVLVVALVSHFRGSSTSSADPSQVSAALALWRGGRYSEGAAALRAILDANPGFEEDPTVASALSGAVDEHEAQKQLDDLMTKTAFGRSSALTGSLADVTIHGLPTQRDAALDLLRDRHAGLTPERRSRVELRDADDCDALASAEDALGALGTAGASDDVAGVRGGECKRILRRGKLCDECRGGGAGSGAGAGNPGDKGKGKGHGHGHGH